MKTFLLVCLVMATNHLLATECDQEHVEALVRGVAVNGNPTLNITQVDILHSSSTAETRDIVGLGASNVEAWYVEVNLHSGDGRVVFQSFEALYAISLHSEIKCHFQSVTQTWAE